MKCKITARARVNPTEDRDKVINAISNIFKFEELKIGEGYVIVTSENNSLLDLRESLKIRKIRDTTERIFLNGTDGNKISFSLSKQAALVSTPNFVDKGMSNLGEIDVTIETDDVEGFIKWMTVK
jgi:predicted RNA binding protein with dsRBD fold (UPF0201 family)